MNALQDMWRICMKDCHSLLDRVRGFIYFCVMIGILLGFCATLIFCVYIVYETADRTGYIQHNRTVNITASSAWLPGERKPCVSYPPRPHDKKKYPVYERSPIDKIADFHRTSPRVVSRIAPLPTVEAYAIRDSKDKTSPYIVNGEVFALR